MAGTTCPPYRASASTTQRNPTMEAPMSMNVMMITSKVKDDFVSIVEEASSAIFSALEEAQPKGMRYAVSRLAQSTTFVILLQLEDSTDNPLQEVPEYRAFLASMKSWLTEPPTTQHLTVSGSYNLF
jgi:hypothetical protein